MSTLSTCWARSELNCSCIFAKWAFQVACNMQISRIMTGRYGSNSGMRQGRALNCSLPAHSPAKSFRDIVKRLLKRYSRGSSGHSIHHLHTYVPWKNFQHDILRPHYARDNKIRLATSAPTSHGSLTFKLNHKVQVLFIFHFSLQSDFRDASELPVKRKKFQKHFLCSQDLIP